MRPESVKGLPPDLSSGFTLTEWECEQRVKAARADYEAAVEALERLINVGDALWEDHPPVWMAEADDARAALKALER